MRTGVSKHHQSMVGSQYSSLRLKATSSPRPCTVCQFLEWSPSSESGGGPARPSCWLSCFTSLYQLHSYMELAQYKGVLVWSTSTPPVSATARRPCCTERVRRRDAGTGSFRRFVQVILADIARRGDFARPVEESVNPQRDPAATRSPGRGTRGRACSGCSRRGA